MNRALWTKSIVEARLLWAGCALLLFAFNWVYIWVSSQVKLGALHDFLAALPENWLGATGMPIADVATVAGRLALGYIDPVIMVGTAIWSIARGSDVVAGELNRGTMEMLLAQPVRRLEVLLTHAAVTIGGAALLALAAFCGTASGLATVTLEDPVELHLFVAPCVNMFSMTFYLAGLATLISSCDRYRWRAIGVMGAYYIFSLVCEVLGKTAESMSWTRYFTFMAAYEPQQMITQPAEMWSLSLHFNGLLLGLGLASYVVAMIVFCRRDIPAPI